MVCPLPKMMQATRRYLQANGLFLLVLAASVAGHVSLKWIGLATAVEPRLAELESGLTSVQVHWVAASEAPEPLESEERDDAPEPAESEPFPEAREPERSPPPVPAETSPDRQNRTEAGRIAERAREVREPVPADTAAVPSERLPERAVPPAPLSEPESAGRRQASAVRRPIRAAEPDAEVPLTVVSEEASGREVPPSFLTRPLPPYPQQLLLRGVEGTVQVRVTIARTGQVTEAALHRSSGYPEMDASALRTVRRWTFSPARRGNLAVETTVVVPVEFTIRVRNR